MKKTIITTLILLTILISIYVIQITVGFPPSDATGSAIKGVQKANKYKIEDNTEVELVGEDIQILLQNDEFQALLKDEDFDKFIKSPNFTEFVNNTNLDTASLGEFKGLLDNQKFQRLSNTNSFSILAKNPQYIDMVRK
tara:strand:+ start:21 stop:437 length:417 start_codon:yes stop_codon:yes gene_type:complete